MQKKLIKYFSGLFITFSMLFFTIPNVLALDMHYGNHCGVGGNDSAAAIDNLDAVCKAHDECCACGKNVPTKRGKTHNVTTYIKGLTQCPRICNQTLRAQLKAASDEFGCGNNVVSKVAGHKGEDNEQACKTIAAGLAYTTVGASLVPCIGYCKKQVRACTNEVSWPY